MENIIILGAGGNSSVIVDIIKKQIELLSIDITIIGFLDDDPTKKTFCGYPVLGGIEEIDRYSQQELVCFVNGIGDNQVRRQIYHKYPRVRWKTILHPSSMIAEDVVIGTGTVVMPGAIINAGTRIGTMALINSGAIVEHDNVIGDFAHLASGAATAGNVSVGEATMLGTGCKVIQGIHIGSECMIGAGACVIRDIPDGVTAVGVPARVIKKNERGQK